VEDEVDDRKEGLTKLVNILRIHSIKLTETKRRIAAGRRTMSTAAIPMLDRDTTSPIRDPHNMVCK
jgi:hypothetical protein